MAPITRSTPPNFLSLIGYLTVLFSLLSVGALCLLLAAHQHGAWLLGVVVAVGVAVRLVARYTAQVLPMRADDKE
jgi:hypothetical protein